MIRPNYDLSDTEGLDKNVYCGIKTDKGFNVTNPCADLIMAINKK